MNSPLRLVVTTEHAGNRVPQRYAHLFERHQGKLATHRGYDLGALTLARSLSRHFRVPLIYSDVTRMLVDLNRSTHNPTIFSRITRDLDPEQKQQILSLYYQPHREAVYNTIRSLVRVGATVIHLGVHTFAPVLSGEKRRADVGLLYDPKRRRERAFCRTWQEALHAAGPGLRVRLNYPYRGRSDGLTTTLRREFPVARYLGIELEVNQGLIENGEQFPVSVTSPLTQSLRASL